MIALFADKLIISTENNSLVCRCQPGPQPNCYPRAIQTSETTPCVFLRSAGKARYASYPQQLQNEIPNFFVADTQGTLTPGNAADWKNEIHPTPSGFEKIADKIYAEARERVPQLPAMP